MKFVIPGGTGQVGTVLARHFHAAGDEVVVLSRHPQEAPWRTVFWDGEKLGGWAGEFEGADAVINLAGRSVNCRYDARNRREIMNSRVRSVRVVGEAIGDCRQPPRAWLQMSTATIYAHRYDAANDERTGILGGCEPDAPDTWRFSIDVARAWEEACDAAPTPDTRKLKLRLAMLMNFDRGGTFDLLLRLVRYGLGGRAGSGRQYMSWIHKHDFVRAVQWLIAHDEIAGAVNVAAPCPLPNGEFMQALRSAWGTRLGLPAAEWMVEVGTWLMRTESELILKSRRVVPGRLLEAGFEFAYPTWPTAARELCDRWRACQQGIRPPISSRRTEKRPGISASIVAPTE
ncbi:MAG TPA: TIGR01777 family oxidoreductase [Pirellulales bacterium]|jgi:hypothetical protein